MRPELTLIPHVTIHPDKLCIWNEINWTPHKPSRARSAAESHLMINPDGEIIETPKTKYDHLLNSSRSAEGKISDIARKKITKAINYLLLLANNKQIYERQTGRHFAFKIAMITLTLPSKQIHDDNTIKRECLNQFLIEAKRRWKMKRYIWRAEKQENGNLHFHLIVDKFIPHQEIRDVWNRIVNKLGYVDHYREEMIKFHSAGFQLRKELTKHWSIESQRKAYQKGMATDWNSPNSTDVHSIRKVINIRAYLTKYLCKPVSLTIGQTAQQQENKIVVGRLWGASQDLCSITGAQMAIDSEIEAELKEIMSDKRVHIYESTYFTVIYIDIIQIAKNRKNALFRYFCEYLNVEFHQPLQLSLT